MKHARLASVTGALLSLSAISGGCNQAPLPVVENDGGTKGDTGDTGSTGNTDDTGTNENDGSIATNDAGVCVPNGITFDLTVGTTDNVFFEGSTPPWPAPSFGCSNWLTITALGESINIAKNGS